MTFIISLYIVFSIFNQIIYASESEPLIIEIENSQQKQIKLTETNLNIIYLVTKNNISGTYAYDIRTPYTLELSYGKSDSKNIIPDLFEGHYEIMNITNGYLYSISVSINDDNKYTFIKMKIKDDINIIKNNFITINLIEVYTLSIVALSLCIFIFVISIILFFFTCGRDFLTECCDFRDMIFGNKKKYTKLNEIYELNVIDIE